MHFIAGYDLLLVYGLPEVQDGCASLKVLPALFPLYGTYLVLNFDAGVDFRR